MKNYTDEIEKLVTSAENYSKTYIKLFTYTTAYKSANIFSSLSVRFVLAIILIFFFFFLNIGIALFLGEYLDKFYYGFFIIAGFYIIIALIFLIFQNTLIKTPVCNFIIRATLNNDSDETK